MNRGYISISISLLLITLLTVLTYYYTIDSIFFATFFGVSIPIIIGFIFDYDRKAKKIMQEFYIPLYFIIKSYIDTIKDEDLSDGKKRDLIDNISVKMIQFLSENTRYLSKNLSKKVSSLNFYLYSDSKDENQKNMNMIKIMPVILKEITALYPLLNIEEAIKSSSYLKNKDFHEINNFKFLLNDCFILGLAQETEAITSSNEIIKFAEKHLDKETDDIDKCLKLYKYCKKNLKRLNKAKELTNSLSDLFNIKLETNK